MTVARRLLGQRLVRVLPDGTRLSGIIVETEAYLGLIDKAAHSYKGKTERAATMWRDGGHAYVYLIYGIYDCMNVVAGRENDPVAVLLRAVEPQEGLDFMWSRRAAAKRIEDLCSGPGKLCQAMGISRDLNGADLTQAGPLFVEQARQRAMPSSQIVVGPRIGVGYAEEWSDKPLRFWVRGHPHVSRLK